MSTLVATPIKGSRVWCTGVSRNPALEDVLILQSWESGSPNPTEWVVLKLASGLFTITETPKYTTTNVTIRTTNGRLWFPGNHTHLVYYDPADDSITDTGPLVSPLGTQSSIYRLSIGPDGKVYAGTQCATGLPIIFRIDPATAAVEWSASVGQLPRTVALSYAYYVFADPPWVYTAVGQSPWQLSARNMVTGEQRILATRLGAGFMSFTARSRGITVVLAADGVSPAETWWLLDGDLAIPFTSANQNLSPYVARDTRPLAGTLSNPVEIDATRLAPESDGTGIARWRPPAGSWTDTPYQVNYVVPVNLESLIALPDGDLLGNAVQYHGFFRFDPGTDTVVTYGVHHPSQPVLATLDGDVYFSGYPNCQLYRYDPDAPWTSAEGASDETTNPAFLGNYTETGRPDAGTHYALALLAGSNGLVYMAGRLERDGTGAGIGSYDPDTEAFAGTRTNLSELLPSGLEELQASSQIVMATRLRVTNSGLQAPLVVYDYALNEIARRTVLSGLINCGKIYSVGGTVVVGVCDTPASKGATNTSSLYRYDVASGTLQQWTVLAARVESSTRRADGVLVAVLGTSLVEIDLGTFGVTTLETVDVSSTVLGNLTHVADSGEVYFTYQSGLRQMNSLSEIPESDIQSGTATIAGSATLAGVGAEVQVAAATIAGTATLAGVGEDAGGPDIVQVTASISGSGTMAGQGIGAGSVRTTAGRKATSNNRLARAIPTSSKGHVVVGSSSAKVKVD